MFELATRIAAGMASAPDLKDGKGGQNNEYRVRIESYKHFSPLPFENSPKYLYYIYVCIYRSTVGKSNFTRRRIGHDLFVFDIIGLGMFR